MRETKKNKFQLLNKQTKSKLNWPIPINYKRNQFGKPPARRLCGPSKGTAPLARAISMSSYTGYHTPVDDDMVADGGTSYGGSMLNTQVDPICTTYANAPTFIPFNDFRYPHQVLLSWLYLIH